MPKAPEICCETETYLTSEVEKDLRDRLSRVCGHIEGIKRMLANHESCDDLLVQLGAVSAALNQVTIKLIEGHMETCVRESVEKGEGVEALYRLKSALAKVIR